MAVEEHFAVGVRNFGGKNYAAAGDTKDTERHSQTQSTEQSVCPKTGQPYWLVCQKRVFTGCRLITTLENINNVNNVNNSFMDDGDNGHADADENAGGACTTTPRG